MSTSTRSLDRIAETIEGFPRFPPAVDLLIQGTLDGSLRPNETRRCLRELGCDVRKVLRQAARIAPPPEESVGWRDMTEVARCLGPRRATRLALITALTRLLLDGMREHAIGRVVWKHSLAVSSMGAEATRGTDADPEIVAVSGLLHELGRIALLRVRPDAMMAVNRDLEDGVSLPEADRRHLGSSAAAVTARLAFSLNLPLALRTVLAGLESPDLGPTAAVQVVSAVDRFAPLVGYPVLSEAVGAPLDPGIERIIGLDDGFAERLANAAASVVRFADQEGVLDAREGGFSALLETNRRMARLHAEYERTRVELERHARETKSLVASFASLTMGLDAEALQYSILESLLEHYDADATFLLTARNTSGFLAGTAFAMDRLGAPEVIPMRLDFGRFDHESRRAIQRGQVITARHGPAAEALRAALDDYQTFFLAPVFSRGLWNGVLGLAKRTGDRGHGDIGGEFLNILATAAALGLENARLYHEVLEQATVDPLTGVATRRATLAELERILMRPVSDRGAVGVLLIDLDNFKSVNDTLGHQAGDLYLRSMAKAMAGCLRPGDWLGRYGGDEFLALLPNVDLDTARSVAEAIRFAAEQVGLEPSFSQIMQPLGASIGVCWWTGDTADAVALLAMADSSLYLAKADGRNTVGATACQEP